VISLIVPTRNRAHTLKLVAPSYFEQAEVDELIFVDDAGDDTTASVLTEIASRYPHKHMQILRNATRSGAPQSRNVGVAHCRNEYVLFCDDDEYLEPGYAKVCLQKLQEKNLGAISGRRVYMLPDETQAQALQRFRHGLSHTKPFRPVLCEYVNGAMFGGDIVVPFTNAIILTRKSLLQQHPFDAIYAQGYGYREETDYQMNLFVHDHAICITNEVHSLHLPMAQVRTGGQRASAARRVYWSIFYTNYFFGKYYEQYAKKLGMRTPRWLALVCFASFAVYRETFRPPLHKLGLWLITSARRRQQAAAAPALTD
jgi:glycosyltransferase involved in cell wall biosynthesis